MSDQKTKPRQFIVVKIADGDEVLIVGTYRDEDTALGSAQLCDGHVLDIEFEVEDSPYGKGVVYLADWLDR